VSDLIELLKKVSRGDVQEQVPLDHRTSVRVGGAAKLLVRPKDPAALVATLGALSDAGVPWVALGGGANTLVGDGGIDGAVIRIAPDFCTDEIEEQGDGFTLTVGAGAPSGRFVSLVREQNGVGIGSWACGIPGTVGGMVTMNAGTPHGTMSDCLEAVEVATPDGLTWLGADKLKFSYRKCSLPSGAILTRARCKVRRGSEAERAHEQRAIRVELELGVRQSEGQLRGPPDRGGGAQGHQARRRADQHPARELHRQRRRRHRQRRDRADPARDALGEERDRHRAQA
jgi:UDP-N-acetylenolpyruvoylglucosamine reductase